MVAEGYALDDKVSLDGAVMSGTLGLQGSPPFVVTTGGGAATAGTATLNGTSAVTVATTAVMVDTSVTAGDTALTVTSLILLTVQPGTAPAGIPYVASLTNGTGFTLKSTSASDTAVVVAWFVVPGAPA